MGLLSCFGLGGHSPARAPATRTRHTHLPPCGRRRRLFPSQPHLYAALDGHNPARVPVARTALRWKWVELGFPGHRTGGQEEVLKAPCKWLGQGARQLPDGASAGAGGGQGEALLEAPEQRPSERAWELLKAEGRTPLRRARGGADRRGAAMARPPRRTLNSSKTALPRARR